MRRDNEHPFFRPLWIRILLVAVVAGWSVLEWANDEPFWGILTLGILAYAVWAFFIAYDPKDKE